MIDSMHQSWLPRVVAAAFPGEGTKDPFALLQRRQPQVVTAARYWSPARPCPALPWGSARSSLSGSGRVARPRLRPASVPFQHLPPSDASAEAALLSHADPEPREAAAAGPAPALALLHAAGARGSRRHRCGHGLGWEVRLPCGALGELGARVGRVAPGRSGPSQPHAVPPAPLCALPPALQAAGRPAPDPAPGLLQDPLLHQLPGELPQVRPGWAGQGRACGRRWPRPPAFPPRLFLLVQAFGGVTVAEFSSRYGPGQRKGILKQFEQGKIQL